jgi:hypothetical protein
MTKPGSIAFAVLLLWGIAMLDLFPWMAGAHAARLPRAVSEVPRAGS